MSFKEKLSLIGLILLIGVWVVVSPPDLSVTISSNVIPIRPIAILPILSFLAAMVIFKKGRNENQ